jgi:hypothetical protein
VGLVPADGARAKDAPATSAQRSVRS